MLDQQRNKPLEAAVDRPMNYDGTMLGVVSADVLEIEPRRNLVVELNRRALPFPPDGIHDVEVDLRAVECAITLVERVWLSHGVERALQFRFRMVPLLDRADVITRPARAVHLRLHPEVAVGPLDRAH